MLGLLTAVILMTPLSPPNPFIPPDGTLPWAIPALPTIPTVATPSISLDEMEHSEGFDDAQTEAEEQTAAWVEPITNIQSALDDWVVEIPDVNGDFDTEIEPISNYGTAFEFADQLGEQGGVLFDYMRSIQIFVNEMLGERTGLLMTFLLVCAVWLALVRIIIFVIQSADMLVSLALQILQIIAPFIDKIAALLLG